MRIRARYLLLMLVVLLVVPGVLLAVNPTTLQESAALKGVYYSETPQKMQLMLQDKLLKKPPPAPQELPLDRRVALINHFRQLAASGPKGSPAVLAAPLRQAPPRLVVLTPDAPRSGSNSYAITDGQNFPDPTTMHRVGMEGVPPYTFVNNDPRTMFFYFKTIPGKTYMIDLSVSGQTAPFSLGWAYNGTVTPSQDSHIIVGVKANDTQIIFYLKSSADFYFYRCELTQVN